MKNKTIKLTAPIMREKYGDDVTKKVIDYAYAELTRLISENQDESKAVQKHTHVQIYPVIAMYRGLLHEGISQDDAVAFIDYALCKEAEPKAKAMQLLCKLPGMYKKMPAIFKSVTLKEFSSDQGFAETFHDTPKTRCKFDMTRCLYYDTCKKNDSEELVKCFCHTDDVTDGNIHPKLCWNRTKTIGEGGDVCDFDLYVIDDKNK